jgi:hypothetical protein
MEFNKWIIEINEFNNTVKSISYQLGNVINSFVHRNTNEHT